MKNRTARRFCFEAHITASPVDVEGIDHPTIKWTLLSYSAAKEFLDNAGLSDYARSEFGFSYRRGGVNYIFYDDKLTPDSRRAVIAHEIGHISGGHIGLNGIFGQTLTERDKARQDRAADEFAAFLLAPKPHPWRAVAVAAAVFLVLGIILARPWDSTLPAETTRPTVTLTAQPTPGEDIYYWTRYGTVYHSRIDCHYIKGRDNIISGTLSEARLAKTRGCKGLRRGRIKARCERAGQAREGDPFAKGKDAR